MNRQQARRNARVEQHMRLVEPLARRYARSSGQDSEDLRQDGLLGLLRAAERYEGSKIVPFAAFARPHVRGAILHYLRDRAAIIRLPRRVQDQASDTVAGFNAASQQRRFVPFEEALIAVDGVCCEQLAQTEKRRLVAEAMQRLSGEERTALVQVILNGQSLRDEARRSGVSAMTVQRRVKRALAQMRSLLSTQLELARSRSICCSSVLIAAVTAAIWRSRPSRQKRIMRSLRCW